MIVPIPTVPIPVEGPVYVRLVEPVGLFDASLKTI
jgi:hypothetical protein